MKAPRRAQRPQRVEIELRELVRDARAEREPQIDWDSLEERLVRHAARPARTYARSVYPLAWAAVAVAALAAMWLVGHRSRTTPPQAIAPAIIEATEPVRRSGDVLAVGTRVEADARDVSVTHRGRATWTLSPASSAVLAEAGERVTVRLERGSVLSEVVPKPVPETFVVEAAGTRIAVHGTVFRVELDGDRVVVQVREGSVAVGPLGSVPTFFLKAPAHGDFAADGRSGSIDGRPLGASPDRRADPLKLGRARPAPVPPREAGSTAASTADLPNEPSISDIEQGIARIVEAAADCFSHNTKGDEGVQITVRTALSLHIDGSGAVSDVDFQPPLAPEVEECAASGIVSVVFAPSKQGASVTRMLELKR